MEDILQRRLLFLVPLILETLVLVNVAVSQNTCTIGTLGDGSQNHPLSQHIFFLHQSQFGSCYGRIKMLRFKLYNQEFFGQTPTNVYVSFWRPNPGGTLFAPIGSVTVLHNATSVTSDVCEFDALNRSITVQPGDRMGIWMEGAALKLNFLTFPLAETIVEAIRGEVKQAALGSSSEPVEFTGPPNTGVIAMEVNIIPLSKSSTTASTLPTAPTTSDGDAQPPTPSNSPNSKTKDLIVTGSVSPSVPLSSSIETPTESTETGSSSSTETSTPVSLNERSTTSSLNSATSDTSTTESTMPTLPTTTKQANSTIDSNVGVSGEKLDTKLTIIVAVASGVPAVLITLLCLVVLCVMVRQWRVGGRPFRKANALVGDGETSQPVPQYGQRGRQPRNQAQGHNYHIVDRNSNYKSSSEISAALNRPDSSSTTTYVSRPSSVAANPLYEVTHYRQSQLSSCYSGHESNDYYSPPAKSVASTYAFPTIVESQPGAISGVNEDTNVDDDDDPYWSPPNSEVELYAVFQNKKFRMIQRSEVKLSETIGEGQFGNVCLGVWTHREESTNVAVKTLRKKARLEDRLKFLREAAIMGQFMHPSIVKMHGVVLRDDPVMIVLELLPRGDLKQYLGELKQKRHSLSQESLQKKFLGFAQQISAGMNYLGNKKFIHRDLAARNILMADEDTCKIGDFGMARDLIHENYYIANGGKIPVKWTSLEALQYQKYSKASDVWSFGVLLYEIWSLGAVPYEGMRALEIIDFLKSGRRLSPPPGCPRAIYELMIQSWHPDAAYRPSFSTYVLSLNNLYEEVVSWSTDQTSAQYQIGRALVLGKSLYRDLQDIYLS